MAHSIVTPASSPRRLGLGFALAATLVTRIPALPVQAAATTSFAPTGSSGITFAASVPLVHQNLPLFRLTRTAPPTALVQNILAATTTQSLAMRGTELVAKNAHGALSAYVDGVRGDAEVFPDFTYAPSVSTALSHASLESVADTVLSRADMIPKDATTAKLGSETPVFGAGRDHTPKKGLAGSPTSRHLFTYVNTVRYAAGLRVVGKGSQAMVAVADDGSIRGFLRRWQAAAVAGAVAPTTTSTQVVSAISTQLKGFQNPRSRITVSRITPVYYDAGANYLQPVYMYFAKISNAGAKDDHVVGYVPIGKLVEPIPVIGTTHGAPPSAPTPGRQAPSNGHAGANDNGGYMQLGVYVNDNGQMQDQSDAYNEGYQAISTPWWAPSIVRTQYYWAATFEYVGDSNQFVNAVDIAYTSPHGDWWQLSTNGPSEGLFSINQIGTNGNPGYGAAAGGGLSTWLLDSCYVIPSAYDLGVTTGDGDNAFWPWFPVFQGLHRALGYRTEMVLGMDGMNWMIAYDQSQGADAVSAYFNNIAAIDFAGMYYPVFDYHLGYNTTWDRASVMIDDRDNGESIFGTAAQGPAYRLDNYWMGD
jgi:hypothetical protein